MRLRPWRRPVPDIARYEMAVSRVLFAYLCGPRDWRRLRIEVDALRVAHGLPPVEEGRWQEIGAPWSGY